MTLVRAIYFLSELKKQTLLQLYRSGKLTLVLMFIMGFGPILRVTTDTDTDADVTLSFINYLKYFKCKIVMLEFQK